MEKVTSKLQERLTANIGEEYEDDVKLALEDDDIDESIKRLLKQDKIQLVNAKNEPVYEKQLHILAEIDEDASPSKYPEIYGADAEVMSPEVRSKTKLVSFDYYLDVYYGYRGLEITK